MSNFSIDIRKWVERTKADMDTVVRMIAIELTARLRASLAAHAHTHGLQIDTLFPPSLHSDWNDHLISHATYSEVIS